MPTGIKESLTEEFGSLNADRSFPTCARGFGVEVGTIMAFSGPDGMEIPGIIADIAGDSVTVDFNHPLAGQDVTFEVEILSVE